MSRKIMYFASVFVLILNITGNSSPGSPGMVSGSGQFSLNDIHLFDANTVMAVGTGGTILNTYNGGANWVKNIIYSSYNMYAIQFLNNNTGWMQSGFEGQILKTTNGSNNWISFNNNGGPFYFVNENKGWTSYSNVGIEIIILKTTNGGVNWISQFSISDNYYPRTVYFDDENTGYVFGVNNGDNSRIIKTTNGGLNWVVPPLINSSLYTFYFINSDTAWAAGREGAILKTTNGWNNWTAQSSGTSDGLNSIEFINQNTGWACGFDIIIKTTNGGASWKSQFVSPPIVFTSIGCYDENNIWTAGFYDTVSSSGVIYKSVNGGSNWINVYDNTVSVNTITSEIPQDYSLYQNYPNPFNPVTHLEFGIPDLGFVSLKVFDISGAEIVTLVNEKLSPGSYKFEFDGSNYASGVYLYKLTTNSFSETKRMILLK